MKLDTKHLKNEIEKLLDETGLSVEELANQAGISKATIYRILDCKAGFSQRAIGRKIAEGTGRKFKIEGDKIYFYKPQTSAAPDIEITEEEWQWLQTLRELKPEDREKLKRIIGIIYEDKSKEQE